MKINEVLHDIQKNLKVAKGQHNDFGSYNYRSQDDILEAVKPLLPDGVILRCTDEILNIGAHNYIKATATIKNDEGEESATSYAREDLVRKKMNPEQLTGSASSYARKYALSGLFALDDTKDSDTNEQHIENIKASEKQSKEREDLYNKISMNMLEFEDRDQFSTWWTSTKQERATLTVYQQKQLIEEMKEAAKNLNKELKDD